MHQLSAFLPAASGVIPYAAVLATKLLRSIAVLKESQKEEKNSNQNCKLACELKPADRQKVIQSLLGESCELNCEIVITQSLS